MKERKYHIYAGEMGEQEKVSVETENKENFKSRPPHGFQPFSARFVAKCSKDSGTACTHKRNVLLSDGHLLAAKRKDYINICCSTKIQKKIQSDPKRPIECYS